MGKSRLNIVLVSMYFYFASGYLFLLAFTQMTTTLLFEYFTNFFVLTLYSGLKQILDIVFLPVLNPLIVSLPSQIYSSGPVIPEVVFYSIILVLIFILIAILENLRKIVVELLNGGFELKQISSRLNNVSKLLVTIFVISFLTTVGQNIVSSGISLEAISSAATPEVFTPIIFVIIIKLIVEILGRNDQLQKEVNSII